MIDIVLELKDARGRVTLEEPSVPLPVDLQEVLGTLVGFPAIARLSELGYYDATQIDIRWLSALNDDISELLDGVQEGRIRLILPDRVGIAFDEDVPMDFGIEGFISWAMSLRGLGQRAIALGLPLLACGN